ncbi:hypothetical protein RHS04_03063 [Rhizoctonia solani]|uniref:Uncharacterized protein n=1 Tax=Rhizoctonia solani TaxID=456999 RepID=A0A8H7LL68_9AGAM|nr:hypothetical protein RHS04_03063 [Rhizoctonia solani]
MSSAPPTPEVPKVQQVLHVYAKSVLSCTFGRSAASSRTGVAPPPSYQSVTVNGVTTLLHLNSRDGTIRTVGSVEWDGTFAQEGAKKSNNHRVSFEEHTSSFGDVLRGGKGLSKDLKFRYFYLFFVSSFSCSSGAWIKPDRSDTRALHLPGDMGSLTFQRVAIPAGGFPFTVYTIFDASAPPGPTPAHTCLGQLTIRDLQKPANTLGKFDPARLRFFGGSDSHKKDGNMIVRLEIRTRDKPMIDKIVFGSLLIIAGKHPVEADSRVEADRLLSSAQNEWDAPPALSNLATPLLSPNPSGEHLPLDGANAAAPQYGDDGGSKDKLLPLPEDPFSQDLPVAGPSTAGPSRSAVAA